MSDRSGRKTRPAAKKPGGAVLARVLRGEGTPGGCRKEGTFTIGIAQECELRIASERVAPSHVRIIFDGARWWARDLGSAGGTFMHGRRIHFVRLPDNAELELGAGGPLVSIEVLRQEPLPPLAGPAPSMPVEPSASPNAPARLSSETQIIQRYLRPSDGPAGRETLMFRRAFARVQRRAARRYQVVIGGAVAVLLAALAVIAYQAHRLGMLRTTAERLFYSMKGLELQAAKVEELVLARADARQVRDLQERRSKLAIMQREYDAFVRELGVYSKLPQDEQVILRVARAFGECEVNVPKGFVAEVKRYVQRWRSTDRLARVLERAKQRGYARAIVRVFSESNLPPQYLYLAAQESGFDERAIGPATRYGYAKGMWQFISFTAHRYGLRLGPLHERAAYDAQDERFDWEKSTAAAARYIKDLHMAEAQGSGLLAMACYNWGESKVHGIIETFPESPQERNFWRLLANRNVPRETYDYVLSIFSAAVICEDPKLFGFDLECPVAGIGLVEAGH